MPFCPTPNPIFQDGTFTIVQFSDVHWKDGKDYDEEADLGMGNVLDCERPDLVVFNGGFFPFATF